MADPGTAGPRPDLRRRVVLLAVFSTLALAAAGLFTLQQRDDPLPVGDGVPRALTAPLFTLRRAPEAFGGLVSRARLLTELESLTLDAGDRRSCVQVRMVGTGEVLFGHNADTPAIPASTMKLLTGAAALEILGPDHRLSTETRATGSVSGGVLQGPLYLVGGGDGLLSTPGYGVWEETRRPDHIPVPPRTDMTALARAIKGLGITRIAGGVIGDASAFDDQRIHPAWKQSYFDEKLIAPITGLAVNRNLVNWGGDLESVTFAADPATHAAEALRLLLVEQGITVDGPAGSGTTPDGARSLASLPSVPLSSVVQHIEQASDNYLAENLLKTLGHRVKGDGSFGAGAEVVVDALTERGVAVKGLVMSDGSGLARSSQIPCTLLADLLARTPTSPGLARLPDLLSVSGVVGTLRLRFPNAELQGQVRGKTGSLDGVSNLAGLVSTADRRGDLAFAVLVNGGDETEAVAIQRMVVQRLLRFPDAIVTPAGE